MNSFKRILKKDVKEDEKLFPNHSSNKSKNDYEKDEQNNLEDNSNKDVINDVLEFLKTDQEFLNRVSEELKDKIILELEKRYDFIPTDKYIKEAEEKKKYINQLDSYLKERQEMNVTIENELKSFLQETTTSLHKALNDFANKFSAQVSEAEKKHGIDKFKNLLDCESNISSDER